jgi:hypothetical protein
MDWSKLLECISFVGVMFLFVGILVAVVIGVLNLLGPNLGLVALIVLMFILFVVATYLTGGP